MESSVLACFFCFCFHFVCSFSFAYWNVCVYVIFSWLQWDRRWFESPYVVFIYCLIHFILLLPIKYIWIVHTFISHSISFSLLGFQQFPIIQSLHSNDNQREIKVTIRDAFLQVPRLTIQTDLFIEIAKRIAFHVGVWQRKVEML